MINFRFHEQFEYGQAMSIIPQVISSILVLCCKEQGYGSRVKNGAMTFLGCSLHLKFGFLGHWRSIQRM